MESPGYDGNEDIPLPEREGDDDGDIPDIPTGEGGEGGETTPAVPKENKPGDKIGVLSNELKRQKIQALYDFLGVEGNVNLAELDRFRLNRNEKTGNAELKFWTRLDFINKQIHW